jgi:ATP-dependent DNA ligase
VRVLSRNGHDWTDRVPRIVEAVAALHVRSATLDGHGVICGPDGKSDFNRIRDVFSRQGSREPSSARSISWSLRAAICATRHGYADAPCWRSSWSA